MGHVHQQFLQGPLDQHPYTIAFNALFCYVPLLSLLLPFFLLSLLLSATTLAIVVRVVSVAAVVVVGTIVVVILFLFLFLPVVVYYYVVTSCCCHCSTLLVQYNIVVCQAAAVAHPVSPTVKSSRVHKFRWHPPCINTRCHICGRLHNQKTTRLD